MKLLSSLLLVFLFGCVSEQRCLERYPPKEVTIWRDTTICIVDTLYFHYQELTFDTTGIFPESIEYHHESHKGSLSSTIDIHKGKLTTTCKEDSLMNVIDHLVHLPVKELHDTKSVPIRDGWYMFWRSSFWILLFLLLVTIAEVIWSKR